MNEPLRRILAPLASLRLTVILLVLSMVLVYAGTWAQVDTGIWQVQKQYFHSLYTWVDFQTFLPRPQPGQLRIPGGFPMPGGYTLGALMLVNLLAAHALRFKFTWKRSGILLIHAGLVLLILGELVTSVSQVESRMVLHEGSSSNYSEDIRHVELAVIDPSPADHDSVAVIPHKRLLRGGTISHPRLPFDIRIDDFYANSAILGPRQAGASPRATAGAGVGLTAVPRPPFSGTEAQSVDLPSAYVTLSAGGRTLGTYLLSLIPLAPPMPAIDQPQEVVVDGRTYYIHLRFARYYKPFTLHLIDFSHDRYLGTEIARNFSSRVRLVDPARNEDREVVIRMNQPLRYGGEAYYQASFLPGDTTSILQVVRNPGWTLPYIACAIGALGMLVHFGVYLVQFLARPPRPAGAAVARRPQSYELRPRRSPVASLVAATAVAVAGAYLWKQAMPLHVAGPLDLGSLGRVAILHNGRVQPLDSVARDLLIALSGRETLRVDGRTIPPIQWLADVISRPHTAGKYPVFAIDHPDVLSLLGLEPRQRRYSFDQVLGEVGRLEQQYTLAMSVDPRQRSLYQRKIVELGNRLDLYSRFAHKLGLLYLVPPAAGGDQWRQLRQAVDDAHAGAAVAPVAEHLIAALQAYGRDAPAEFNRAIAAYHDRLAAEHPDIAHQARFEAFFRRFAPFHHAMVLYVLVFILAAFSWMAFRGVMGRAALWLLVLTIVLHTLGLAARVYITGRPPVTNLASSAFFIGWGAALLALGLELAWRNGIGLVTAAVIGAVTLLVGRMLSTDDTMKVLQAVLDTNFWLATHVVAITLGYSAMFVAGAVGILYVLSGVLTPWMTRDGLRALSRMLFGTTCFAMFFSFVGTILGGIWADQSWGRFWGWDPKENGAILVVLWTALILHARWAGLAGDRGVALLAIGGNIITAWSWFGTNMLGVGLHSYGFMDSALAWLLAFVASQLLLIAIGSIPQRLWLGGNNASPAPADG